MRRRQIGQLNTAITDINSIVKSETSLDGAIKWSVWLELFTSPPLRLVGLFSYDYC